MKTNLLFAILFMASILVIGTDTNGQDRYPFMEESGWVVLPVPTYNVAVVLAEPVDISHDSSLITAQPCKLLPEKTYPSGHSKEYYQDLAYCVADYHKENSFETLNLNFEIFDDNGNWFKTAKNGGDYAADKRDFVIEAINLATSTGIDLSNKDIVIVVYSGELRSHTWSPNSQPLGYPSYKIIVSEDNLVGAWAHEIGHIIGALIAPESTIIPDLSRDDIPMGFVEKWDLMARGSWNDDGKNPPHMSSYTKEFLQWLNYDIHPKSAYGEYWIGSLETSRLGDDIFRYNLSEDVNDESPKYYILEARNRNLKTWDSSLPGLPIIEDKNLILYYINTRELPEYGYVPESITEYQEGMMWNQYRKVTIPGNNPKEIFEINDGILNPLINETYRDFDSLVKFTARTDRTINDKYEIQTGIEEITYDSFGEIFLGVILKPSSLFEQKIKTLPAIYNLNNSREVYDNESNSLKNQLNMPLPPTEAEKVAGVGKYFFLFSIPLVLLSFLLLCLDGAIISRLKSGRCRGVIKNIFRIIWVITLIFLIALTISIISVYILGEIEPSPPPPCPLGTICESSPTAWTPLLSYTISPDLDLHLYCTDGRHIGMNHETSEYEIQIPEAIVSGDNQNTPEWIFVLPDVTGCHFVVSSYDNQKFLEENPEIAREMTDTTDSYEVYARYIDPETAIYTSVIISEDIEPAEELEQPITGAADITALPAIPWKVPKYLKETSIARLEKLKENNGGLGTHNSAMIALAQVRGEDFLMSTPNVWSRNILNIVDFIIASGIIGIWLYGPLLLIYGVFRIIAIFKKWEFKINWKTLFIFLLSGIIWGILVTYGLAEIGAAFWPSFYDLLLSGLSISFLVLFLSYILFKKFISIWEDVKMRLVYIVVALVSCIFGGYLLLGMTGAGVSSSIELPTLKEFFVDYPDMILYFFLAMGAGIGVYVITYSNIAILAAAYFVTKGIKKKRWRITLIIALMILISTVSGYLIGISHWD